ncbi:MAG: PH domain-containing protein, partial [Nakamurella sp.]
HGGHDGWVRILDQLSSRSATRLSADHVFRPPVGLLAGALWAVVTLLWIFAAASAGIGGVARQLPLMVLIGTLVHAGCTRPLVAVGPDGVLLRNVFRDVRMSWPALAAMDTRYALTLTDRSGRRFRAWAAPAPSRFTTARTTPSDLQAVRWNTDDGPIPASATLRSDAGAAAALIRRFWTPPAHLAAADPMAARAEVRWATGVLLVLGLAAAASVAVLMLP